MSDDTLIMICGAGALGIIVYLLSLVFNKGDEKKVRQRLKGDGKFAETAATRKALDGKGSWKDVAQKIGQAAATPFMPKTREKQSGLRQKLARAGIYSATAFRALTGGKVIALGAGVGIGYFVGALIDQIMGGIALGGLIGYMAPTLWLNMKIKANQKALNEGLADALDLMVVCIEAGLTVDGAMQRVAADLALAHPSLSRELNIAHMETRVGLSRSESLKNLGKRTGNVALQSLASMLIQADRFGTSIATALRVHSETLRTSRQFAAEEKASKAAVKLTFPLVLFIFPATFIVLAGPTAVQVMNSELMK